MNWGPAKWTDEDGGPNLDLVERFRCAYCGGPCQERRPPGLLAYAICWACGLDRNLGRPLPHENVLAH